MQKSVPKVNVVVHVSYSVIQFLGMWARVDPKGWDGDTSPSQNKPNWSNPQQLRKVQSFVERCWKGGSQLCKGKSAQKIIIRISVCLVCIGFMCSVPLLTGTVYMSCFNYWVSFFVILWATHKLYCRSVRVRLNTKLNLSANWRLKHLLWLTLYRNWMKSRYCLLFFWCFHIVARGQR